MFESDGESADDLVQWSQSHEAPNLFVMDAAPFNGNPDKNVTLTIVANALRVGDHLLERLGAQGAAAKRMNGTLKQPLMPELAAIA